MTINKPILILGLIGAILLVLGISTVSASNSTQQVPIETPALTQTCTALATNGACGCSESCSKTCGATCKCAAAKTGTCGCGK